MASVAIVGGGIVGSAAAVWLIAEGHDVTVFERDPEARLASTGNAGVASPQEISPMGRPGILASVPRWLLDPLGPLTIRYRDLPALVPWLGRFLLSARRAEVERATAALAWLMHTAIADHRELARRADLPFYMRQNGALYIFDTDAAFDADAAEWRERAAHGVAYREVTVAEARAIVPALRGPFARALFVPDSWSITSPIGILHGLRNVVIARNALRTATVTAVHPDGDKIAVVTGETRAHFDRVVIAGGVWSSALVAKLGLRVLLAAERGYNTTFPGLGAMLPVPVFFAGHGFVASPLDDGLRIGGAVELASPEAPPNFARAAAMRAKARRYLPDIPEEGGREWMGSRPATPDSLAVIGPHPSDPRVVFAFGHGHLGMTFSAVTARHVADLIAGKPAEPGLAPFGIGRFN